MRTITLLPFAIILVSGLLRAQSVEDLLRLRQEYEAATKTLELEPSVREEIEGEKPAIGVLQAKVAAPAKFDRGYFGYGFFSDRGRIDLWENLPMPRDYRLGSGDEIIVSLWGETQSRSEHTISRSGTIYIDKVGQLSLLGKTLKETKSYLKSRFEQVYSTMKGPRATTFMDVSIGKLKLINVTFLGEVHFPGIHAVHPFSRVTTGLIQAGGLQVSGTLRNIQVIRDNRTVATVDLYNFLLKGGGSTDIQLRDQD
ncbi:MAG: polysaccharide biosynthesis/export family protein, partial [Candidatus Neomarinimicrobiota bacterium]